MDQEKDDALAWISDETVRTTAFARGENFAKAMARLVTAVADEHGYTRYLVI